MCLGCLALISNYWTDWRWCLDRRFYSEYLWKTEDDNLFLKAKHILIIVDGDKITGKKTHRNIPFSLGETLIRFSKYLNSSLISIYKSNLMQALN